MSDGGGEFYWCLRHQRVEPAEEACPAENRMGPYGSREEARAWRDKVEQRNEAWKEQDREWEGEDPED